MRSSLNVLAGIVGILSICKDSNGKKSLQRKSIMTGRFLFADGLDSLQGYHEKRLLNSFFGPGSNYSSMERPILNESLALPVHFGLTLQQIMDLDERNQLLSTTLWITMVWLSSYSLHKSADRAAETGGFRCNEWNDYNLKWNSSEYGGLLDIRVHPDKVWKPDILLYNSADERFENTFHSNVVVYSSGDCVYIPPGIFKSTCKINIESFPFDEQNCTLKFGSWSYDGNRIDLQLKKNEADLSGFMKNGEWELIGVPAKRNVIRYDCCPEPYVDVTFSIIIRRRVLFYVFNLVIPCALISSITLLGFCLPVESGEKLTLGVTILLSLTVFLLMVAESMPATSDAIPLLGTYFSLIMVMTGLSVVLTVTVLNVHFRTPQTHIMYPWVTIIFCFRFTKLVRKVLLVWLPFILGLKRPGPIPPTYPPKTKICRSCFKTVNNNSNVPSNSDKTHGRSLNALDLESRSCSLLANVLELDDRPKSLQLLNHNSFSPDHQYVVRRRSRYQQPGRVENVDDILNEIRYVADRMRAEDTDTITTNDWKFAAMVLDRLFLWIIVMFTIGFTGVILASAPHFQV